jgi:AP-4 complex subunit beta-1
MVLGLVAKYRPADHEEMFAIMNVLDGCLRVSNSAVVVGATKCFLQFAESVPDIKYQVYNRLKQPMLTLMAGSPSHEVWTNAI